LPQKHSLIEWCQRHTTVLSKLDHFITRTIYDYIGDSKLPILTFCIFPQLFEMLCDSAVSQKRFLDLLGQSDLKYNYKGAEAQTGNYLHK
jgi:hypothetical protein